jgi:hypothetical protein
MFDKYRRAPNLIHVDSIKELGENSTCIDGNWFPTRPLGLDTIPNRIRLAIGVLSGKYDALKWGGNQ